jgi:hypothetical protein
MDGELLMANQSTAPQQETSENTDAEDQKTDDSVGPFVVDDSPRYWHPIRCAKVRSAEVVRRVSDVTDQSPCPWCQLFCTPETIIENTTNKEDIDGV